MARITRMTKRRLGELLQAEGILTEEQVKQGLEEQRRSNMFLGEALVKLGFLSEEAIAKTIVQQFSLPFMSAQQYTITPEVINIFPEHMYFEYQFVAADKIGSVLIIIGAGLMNHDVLDELERLSGCKVCQFVSTWKDIRATLDKYQKDIRKEQVALTSLGTLLLDDDTASNTAVAAAPAAHAPSVSMPVPPVMAPAASAAPHRPAAAAPPAPPKPATAQPPGPPSQRLSALAGIRPPTNKAPTPPVDPKQPAAAQPKSTLLGLFKKS